MRNYTEVKHDIILISAQDVIKKCLKKVVVQSYGEESMATSLSSFWAKLNIWRIFWQNKFSDQLFFIMSFSNYHPKL